MYKIKKAGGKKMSEKETVNVFALFGSGVCLGFVIGITIIKLGIW